MDSFSLSLQAWYLDDSTIIGDTLVVGKVLELILEDGPRCGLHLNTDKNEIFWPKEDPRSRLAGVFSLNIGRPLHGVKLLCGPASVDLEFSSELVLKRVAKIIELMDAVSMVNDPQYELLLLHTCAERIVTAYGPRFGEWQWTLAKFPLSFEGLGVYSTGLPLKIPYIALWKSQMENHTSDWIKVVLISGLGQTINGDIYGDHVVSCAGIIWIKHRHNVVRDTLFDICFWSGILAGMVGFVPGRIVIDAAQRKRVKYEAKCADIGYGFLPFLFSSFGELEKDAIVLQNGGPDSTSADVVTLLKRILKFSMAQDIWAWAAIHIFNRISFAIVKGVGTQIVSRLSSNLL
ncbi:hypothetical protein Tco_0267441 [Tanacetum coccineum]